MSLHSLLGFRLNAAQGGAIRTGRINHCANRSITGTHRARPWRPEFSSAFDWIGGQPLEAASKQKALPAPAGRTVTVALPRALSPERRRVTNPYPVRTGAYGISWNFMGVNGLLRSIAGRDGNASPPPQRAQAPGWGEFQGVQPACGAYGERCLLAACHRRPAKETGGTVADPAREMTPAGL